MNRTEPKGPGRGTLIDAILEFVADQDLLTAGEIRVALEREIDDAGPDAPLALKSRLSEDNGWGFCPREPPQRSCWARDSHPLLRRIPADNLREGDCHVQRPTLRGLRRTIRSLEAGDRSSCQQLCEGPECGITCEQYMCRVNRGRSRSGTVGRSAQTRVLTVRCSETFENSRSKQRMLR